jgi:hypothetical protein
VVFDPKAEWAFRARDSRSKSKNTPFDGLDDAGQGALDDQRRALKKLESEVKARYPVFADTEERRAEAYENLTRMLTATSSVNDPDEGFDWRRFYYGTKSLVERQEILSFERLVPYEIASQHESKEVFVRQVRHLARFYWSKFVFEQGRGFGYFGDLERAEYLLDLAKRKMGARAYLYNDLGNVRLEAFRARVAALRPLQAEPSVQREIDLAAVEDLELVAAAVVGGEEAGYVAQALG